MENNVANVKEISSQQSEIPSPPVEYLERSYNRRRSSILKPAKLRNPLQELDFNPSEDAENTVNVTRKLRRVSFAAGMQVKEFVEVHTETETMTLWGSSYEQTFGHSDTLHHSDISSAEESHATSNITNISTLVTGKINTAVTNLINLPNIQRSKSKDEVTFNESSIKVGILHGKNQSVKMLNDVNKSHSNNNYNVRQVSVSFTDRPTTPTLESKNDQILSGCSTSSNLNSKLRIATLNKRLYEEDRTSSTTPFTGTLKPGCGRGLFQNPHPSSRVEQKEITWQSLDSSAAQQNYEHEALDLTTSKSASFSTSCYKNANDTSTYGHSSKYIAETSCSKVCVSENDYTQKDHTTFFDKSGFLGLMDLTQTVGRAFEETFTSEQQSNKTAYEDNMDFTEPITDVQFFSGPTGNSELNKTGFINDEDISKSFGESIGLQTEFDERFHATTNTLSRTLFDGEMDFTETIQNNHHEEQSRVFVSGNNFDASYGGKNECLQLGNKTVFEMQMDFTEPVNCFFEKSLMATGIDVYNRSDYDDKIDVTEQALVQKIQCQEAVEEVLGLDIINSTDDNMEFTDVITTVVEHCKQICTSNKTVITSDDMDLTEPVNISSLEAAPPHLNSENVVQHNYEVQNNGDSEHVNKTVYNDNMDFTETVNTVSLQNQSVRFAQIDEVQNVNLSADFKSIAQESCSLKFNNTVYEDNMEFTEVIVNVPQEIHGDAVKSRNDVENMDLAHKTKILHGESNEIYNKTGKIYDISKSNYVRQNGYENLNIIETESTVHVKTEGYQNVSCGDLVVSVYDIKEDFTKSTLNKIDTSSTTQLVQYEKFENANLLVSCLPMTVPFSPKIETVCSILDNDKVEETCLPINKSNLEDHDKISIPSVLKPAANLENLEEHGKISMSTLISKPWPTENSEKVQDLNSINIDHGSKQLDKEEPRTLVSSLLRLSQKRNYKENTNHNATENIFVQENVVSPSKRICCLPFEKISSPGMELADSNCLIPEINNVEFSLEDQEKIEVGQNRSCDEVDVVAASTPESNFPSARSGIVDLTQEDQENVPLNQLFSCNDLVVVPANIIDNQLISVSASVDHVPPIDLKGRTTQSPYTKNYVRVYEESQEKLICGTNKKNIYEIGNISIDKSCVKLAVEREMGDDGNRRNKDVDLPVGPAANITSKEIDSSNHKIVLEETVELEDSLSDTSLGIIEQVTFCTFDENNLLGISNRSFELTKEHLSEDKLFSSPKKDQENFLVQVEAELTNTSLKPDSMIETASLVHHLDVNKIQECRVEEFDCQGDTSCRAKSNGIENIPEKSPLTASGIDRVELLFEDDVSVELQAGATDNKSVKMPNLLTFGILDSSNPILAAVDPISEIPVPIKKPPTIEDVIKSQELQSKLWRIKELKREEWIFTFFYHSLELVMKLDLSHMDDCECKEISELYFSSCCTDESNALCKLTHQMLMLKFQTDNLKALCANTNHVLSTLTTVSSEVQKITTFIKDFYALKDLYDVKMIKNSVIFDIASYKIHILFVISINMSDNWEEILPANVNIKQIVGEVNESEIKQLANGVGSGPHSLRDYIKDVHKYIETLEKYGGY